MIRSLKYYDWSFEKRKISLLDKRATVGMVLAPATSDSFVRAWISFKNRQRIEEKEALRKAFKKQAEKYQEKIERLKSIISKLRAK